MHLLCFLIIALTETQTRQSGQYNAIAFASRWRIKVGEAYPCDRFGFSLASLVYSLPWMISPSPFKRYWRWRQTDIILAVK